MSDSARGRREEDELMRASRELLARDKLSDLASKPSRVGGRESVEVWSRGAEGGGERRRSEMIAAERGAGQKPASAESYPQGKYGRESGGLSTSDFVDDGHDRLSIRSEESEDNSVDQQKSFGIQKVEDFVDIESLSAASRRTAAPHIYNIFEQIFIHGTDAEHKAFKVPELPEELRDSLRVSGRYVEGQLGLTGPRAQVQLELDQCVEAAIGRGKASFLKQVAADLSVALRIEKVRLEVLDVRPSVHGEKSVVELRVLPDREGRPPSALQVSETLREDVASATGVVKSMSSTRRAVDVKYREMQPPSGVGLEAAQPIGPVGDKYEFSLIRGGIVLDDRGARPAMSAVHGQTPVLLTPPPLDDQERRERQALHAALAEEEREITAARKVEAAMGSQEGFWVDVEGGKHREKSRSSGAYGTFMATTARSKMPGAVFVVLYAGGLVMISLAVWLLYLHWIGPDSEHSPSAPSSH